MLNITKDIGIHEKNKMKNRKYYTVKTIPISNRTVVERK